VARQFGVKRTLLPFTKRATFVIDTDRRVLAVIHSEFDTDRHGEEALSVLQATAGAGGAPAS
jgi:peroxiredoxin Q/BCP